MSNIALHIQRAISGSVLMEAPVLFDQILYSSGDIAYNAGEITISAPGRFVFSWWVCTHSQLTGTGPVFRLQTSTGINYVSNTPVKKGVVYGTAIVDVSLPPATISLISENSSAVFYPDDVPIKATLVVVQDDEAFMPQGTFATFTLGPIAPGAIIPLDLISNTNTPGAFTLNPAGEIVVTYPGVYLADGRVQVAPLYSCVMGLQKNDEGIEVPYYNAGTTYNNIADLNTQITISTLLVLSAGDRVSLVNSPLSNTIELLGPLNTTITPTGAIRLVRISVS